MKNYILVIFAVLFGKNTSAQVPEPTILSIESLNGDAADIIYSYAVEDDGGFIITLRSNSKKGSIMNVCSNYDKRYIFRKYNSDATQIEWTKCYDGNQDTTFEYLFPQKNGDNIFIGRVKNSAIVACRENNSGAKVWGVKSYGGSGGEVLKDVVQTKDRGMLILAASNSLDGDVGKHYGGVFNNDIWLVKLDTNGNILWSNVFGGTDSEYPAEIIEIPNNQGFYITAYSYSNDFDCIGNHGSSDILVIKVDTFGNKVWSKCFGGSSNEQVFNQGALSVNSVGLLYTSISSSQDGDISFPLAGGANTWLVNIDSSGSIKWNYIYGGEIGDHYGSLICRSVDGSIWIAGHSNRSGKHANQHFGKRDAYIIHVDSNGAFLSSKVMGSKDDDDVQLLHALSDGTIFVAGQYEDSNGVNLPSSYIAGNDLFFARIAPWPVSVNEYSKGIEYTVYPNPNNGICVIQVQGNVAGELFVRDMLGKVVQHQQVSNSKSNYAFSMQGASAGMYIVQLKTEDGSYVQKMIIRK